MKYFILLQGDSEESVLYETNELGEDTGFGIFWGGYGLKILMEIVDKNPEYLPQVIILDDRKSKLSVNQFLEKIKGLKVRLN